MTTLVRLLGALAVTLAAVPSFAQQTTGTITGRVIDPQGMAVPGATITAMNSEWLPTPVPEDVISAMKPARKRVPSAVCPLALTARR